MRYVSFSRVSPERNKRECRYKRIRARRPYRCVCLHNRQILSCLLLALIIAGCSDPPAYNQSTTQEYDFNPSVKSRPYKPVKQPIIANAAPSAGYDPLVTPDPNTLHNDPLLRGTDTQQPDLMTNTTTIMPTEHSHWLRGSIINARVSVILNALKLGDYATNIDKDITMKCRKGVNTITIAYTPYGIGAMANIDILESEHNPPIPPLASFKSSVESANSSNTDPSKPITQTYTFTAY